MIKRVLIIFYAFAIGFFAFTTNAQLQNSDLVLSVNPQYPEANSNVTITASTYSTDLNKAKFSWTLDGNLSLEGIGKKTFSFTSGESGSSSTIQVKVETTDGGTIEKQIIVNSKTLDVLWEAYDSYVPPFYKGKKLGSSESSFKVVAIPSAKNLTGYSYEWKLDGTTKPASSGYEKNYFFFKKSYLDSSNIVSVIASDLFSKNASSGSTTITSSEPKIIFYKKDPSLGIKWGDSIRENIAIDKTGIILAAEPYFFSQKELESSNISYAWYINGEKTNNNQNTLSITPEVGTTGVSTIKVVINNLKTLFQSSEKNLNVSF